MNDNIQSSVNDYVEMTVTETKKESVLERLNKRNKDRLNFLDLKVEQRNKDNFDKEGEDHFAQIFSQRAHEIMTRIKNVCDVVEKNTNDSSTNADLGRIFINITMEIRELQNYLTLSTIFLTEFKVKSCQNEINEINNFCEQSRNKFIPKKKFGFSNRNIKQKSIHTSQSNEVVKLDSNNKNMDSLIKTNKPSFMWTLSNCNDEYIHLSNEKVDEKDVTLSNLKNCFIELQGHPGSVQVSNLKNCTLLSGPISRSFFAENCQNCTLALACQQLRLHSSLGCRIFLFVTCRAIIEDSKGIEFSNYNYNYPSIEKDFEKANLNKSVNNYKDIADFNWLSPDIPSPNWKLSKDDTLPNWHDIRDKFKNKFCLK